MPLTFADCAQYRTRILNDDEREIIQNAQAVDAGRQLQEGETLTPMGVLDANGTLNFHQEIVEYTRMATKWAIDDVEQAPFPEGLDDMQDFAGMDPSWHYSAKDMTVAQRLEQIKSRAFLLSDDHQTALNTITDQFHQRQTPLGRLYQGMLRNSEDYRMFSRAQKMAPTQGVFDNFTSVLNQLSNNDAFRQMDDVLDSMEYMVGLRQTPPTPAQQALLQTLVPTLDALHETSGDLRPRENTLDLNFSNFDNIIAQRYLAHPQNWGKTTVDVPADYTHDAVAQRDMQTYAIGTAKNKLNALFDIAESRNADALRTTGTNRGNLITVDGTPVYDLMLDAFQKIPGSDPSQYPTWYKDNVNTLSAAFVSAGLMAGKRVELFVPDKDGRVPQEPVTLHKTGYEPSPLKPVTFNAWHRFFSKMGFYKERVEQKEEFERVTNGRNRVQAINANSLLQESVNTSSAIHDSYVGPYEQVHGSVRNISSPSKLRLFRGGCVVGSVAQLIEQGCAIEDIYDPNKLSAQKQAAGTHYVAMALVDNMPNKPQKQPGETTGNYYLRLAQDPGFQQQATQNETQMGHLYFQAQRRLLRFLDEKLQGQDFSKIEQRPDFPLLAAISHDIFDMDQEKDLGALKGAYFQDAVNAYQTDAFMINALAQTPLFKTHDPLQPLSPEQQNACFQYAVSDALGVANLFRYTTSEIEAKAVSPAGGDPHYGQALKSTAVAALCRETMVQRAQARPNFPASKLWSYDQSCQDVDRLDRAIVQVVVESTLNEKLPVASQRAAFVQQLNSGQLAPQLAGLKDAHDVYAQAHKRIQTIETSLTKPMTMPSSTPISLNDLALVANGAPALAAQHPVPVAPAVPRPAAPGEPHRH